MLLTGCYGRTLDEKQRFALPKQWRDLLAGTEPKPMYMTPGTDGCLAVYTEAAFEDLGKLLAQHSPASVDVRSFSRMFYARATQVDLDRQGRIRIPAEQVGLASISTEIMLLGVRDHIEIWQPEAWKSFETRTQLEFDQMAERAFAKPI